MDLNHFHQLISRELPQLLELADKLGIGLRFIGGVSRDYLANDKLARDIDIEAFSRKENQDFENFWQELKLAVTAIDSNPEFLDYNIIRFELSGYEIEFSPIRTENFNLVDGHKNFQADFHCFLSSSIAFKRRDLTINAIAFTYENNSFVLDDPFDGVLHLKQKQADICDEATFYKDPVRSLRLFRFCVNFDLDPMIDISKLSLKGISGHYFFYEASKAKNLAKFFSYRAQNMHYDEYLRLIGIEGKRQLKFQAQNLPIELKIAYEFETQNTYEIFAQLGKKNIKQLHHLLKLTGEKSDFKSLLELEDKYIQHHPFFSLKEKFKDFEIDLSLIDPPERQTYKIFKFLESVK